MRKGFVAGAIVIVVALVGLWAAAWTLSPDRWRQRAEQGNADAQVKLGVAYYFGNGVAQDYVESVKWYRKAADQGDATAQLKLGLAYDEGKGVTQDYAEAHKWYNLSAAAGNTIAGELRDIVAQKMTPEQIAEAQRLAREWKPKE